MSKETKHPERDWTEDFGHENGNYQCICGDCGETFIGHKRRVTCKKCASHQPVEGYLRDDELIERKELIRLLQSMYEKLPVNSDYAEAKGDGIQYAINIARKMEISYYASSLPTVKAGKNLQECKDEIARNYKHENWDAMIKYIANYPCSVDKAWDKAVEPYAYQPHTVAPERGWLKFEDRKPEVDQNIIICWQNPKYGMEFRTYTKESDSFNWDGMYWTTVLEHPHQLINKKI